MLKNLIGAARRFTRNPIIPVPEAAINAVLPHAVRDISEVRSLRIAVRDGHFDAIAHVNKEVLFMDVNADATVGFVIDAARISASEQWVVLRRQGKMNLRGHDVIDKIAAAVVEALVISLLAVDPVESATRGLPNIRRDGDCYHVDLGPMLPEDWTTRLEHPLMRLGHVHAIRCKPGRLELALKVGTGTKTEA